MFLHIGGGKYLRTDDIIGFFDIETSTHEVATRNFLKYAETSGITETVCKDLPKSFVPMSPRRRRAGCGKTKSQKSRVYISASAVTTLKNRAMDVAAKIGSNGT